MSLNKINVILVDDNKKILISLEKSFSAFFEINVLASFQSAKAFLQYMSDGSNTLMPHIVLTDIDMPEMNGILLVQIGKIKYPQIKFIMLTIHDDEQYLFEAIKMGASGYLLKDDSIQFIVAQLKTLIQNEGAPMSPTIAKKTLQLLQNSSMNRPAKASPQVVLLSKRELEVLHLMKTGKTYKMIGSELFISPNTVKRHIANIYEKLHISNKAEAVQIANKIDLL